MKKLDLLRVFGSSTALAEAIGISQPAVYRWTEDVPRARVKSVQMALREKAAELDALAKEIRAMAEEQ